MSTSIYLIQIFFFPFYKHLIEQILLETPLSTGHCVGRFRRKSVSVLGVVWVRSSFLYTELWDGLGAVVFRGLGMVFDNVEQLIIVKNLNLGYVFYHLVETFRRCH